jgi:hypothetical protein
VSSGEIAALIAASAFVLLPEREVPLGEGTGVDGSLGHVPSRPSS